CSVRYEALAVQSP
ncbi:unnamed protein product, partial [Rhizophagus irregularis]